MGLASIFDLFILLRWIDIVLLATILAFKRFLITSLNTTCALSRRCPSVFVIATSSANIFVAIRIKYRGLSRNWSLTYIALWLLWSIFWCLLERIQLLTIIRVICCLRAALMMQVLPFKEALGVSSHKLAHLGGLVSCWWIVFLVFLSLILMGSEGRRCEVIIVSQSTIILLRITLIVIVSGIPLGCCLMLEMFLAIPPRASVIIEGRWIEWSPKALFFGWHHVLMPIIAGRGWWSNSNWCSSWSVIGALCVTLIMH